jgi:NAD-dependent aldehyde dehydrogenases
MKVPIGASWVDRDEKTPVINPATGEPVDYVPSLTVDDVRSAIDAAYEALDSVQSLTIAKRARLLLRAADMIRQRLEDLARTMALEIGRPVRSARLEVERAAQIFELAASEVRRALTGEFVPLEMYEWPAGNENRVAMVKREPVGVVASITPFNFPAASFAHKVAPALAVGNTVVHKPPQRPLTQIRMAGILLEAGFPPGSVNVVTGDPVKIGDELVANDKIALITFTGSDRTGLGVIAPRAISRGKRLIMELGGSDAMVVLEDADLARAAKAAVYGRFDYSGQFCNATKRLIVRREVAERFAEFLVEEVRRLKVGDPLDEGTDIGPLISQDAVRSMRSFLEDAVARGGQILVQLKAPEKGFYFPPTVIRLDLRSGARSLREEVFGPIFPVVVVEDDEEAVEAANATDYGLDAAIFTRDFARAYRLASRIKAGTIMVNDTTRLRWDALPFGGFKRSAVGREGVYHTMLAMTELKVIAWRLD